MLISIIVVGLVALIGLAVAVGLLEGSSQEAAWRRIARRRHEQNERGALLAEKERELWAWEAELVAAARSGGCPVCELRRGRGEHPGD